MKTSAEARLIVVNQIVIVMDLHCKWHLIKISLVKKINSLQAWVTIMVEQNLNNLVSSAILPKVVVWQAWVNLVMTLQVNLKAKSKTWSMYATDTFSFSDMYHLTLSGRYNHTKIDNKDGLEDDPPETLTEKASFSRFNPAIGLSITPNKDFSFYGSYNEGSRAPTAIELGCAFQDLDGDGFGDTPCRLPNAMAGDPPLKKVVSKTFEAGVRGNLAGEIGYSASIYRTQNTDDIQFIAANSQGDGNFRNVGKTRRQGLDLGLNGKAWSNFSWNLAIAISVLLINRHSLLRVKSIPVRLIPT